MQNRAHGLCPSIGLLLLVSLAGPAASLDSDLDGVDDPLDNCIETPNDQLDADLDGYGNACDGDFNNDGLVAGDDYLEMTGLFGCEHGDACWGELAELVDLDGSGSLGGSDHSLWRIQFARSAPEPSGLPCASRVPCTPPPPLPHLPVVVVKQAKYGDALDQTDIDAALVACHPGCNLLFLATTYSGVALVISDFPDGFAMFGYRDPDPADETVLRSPLFHEIAHDWQPVIRLGNDAPAGVIVQDLTLDGRKHEQQPPLREGGYLLRGVANLSVGFWGRDNAIRPGGTIRRVEARDFVSSGLSLGRTPSWTIEDSLVTGIGCDQLYEPCGDRGSAPTSWDVLADQSQQPPGTKYAGIGIVVGNFSSDSVVSRTRVERATKFGIEIYGDACVDPDTGAVNSFATRRVTLSQNVVWDSHDGITVNGGCDHLVERNQVFLSNAAAASSDAPFGAGFKCGYGAGTVWRQNEAIWNAGSGFALDCQWADGIVFERNLALGNCWRWGRSSDLSLSGGFADDGVAQPEGLLIAGFATRGGFCSTGINLVRRTGVTITGSDIEGGREFGILLQETNDVVIERTVVRASQFSTGGDVGIYFDRYKDNPNSQPYDDMSDVYVLRSTTIEGFDEAVAFEAPLERADGDDVAYCAEETLPLEGCAEAP